MILIKTVSKLKVGENSYIDQFEILEKKKVLWVTIPLHQYQSQNFQKFAFFNPENVTALREEETKRNLVKDERTTKNVQMRSSKKPRHQWSAAEFYRFVWPDICHDLLASYNFASQHSMLSISQRRLRNNLAYPPQKISKNPNAPRNLRPTCGTRVEIPLRAITFQNRAAALFNKLPIHVN